MAATKTYLRNWKIVISLYHGHDAPRNWSSHSSMSRARDVHSAWHFQIQETSCDIEYAIIRQQDIRGAILIAADLHECGMDLILLRH